MAFIYPELFRSNLPAAAAPWTPNEHYNFIGGHNDPEGVPVDGLIEAAQNVLQREGKDLALYGLNQGPQGYLPLREFITEILRQRAEMHITPEDILVTGGSLQCLDLVNQLFLEPGDYVITEMASYGGALSRLRQSGAEPIGVPLDQEGLIIPALAEILDKLRAAGKRAKFIYTIPTVQNPTGTVLSRARREELLALAEAHQTPIFEDDCYADLLWDGPRPPALHALDRSGLVIYCGSFSKSIAPALRVGYMVADWSVLSRLLAIKTDGGTGALEQMVLADYCRREFDAHTRALSQRLQHKCNIMMQSLAREFGTAAEFTAPKGGIFLWVSLPEQVDTSALAAVAAAEDVTLNAGAEWMADPAQGRHRLRLCFANPSPEIIEAGIAKLADICHREFGLPTRSGNISRD